ncbi:MAG: hypothetical protein U0Q18_16665, partial [Bryobacteraceae bacterium]
MRCWSALFFFAVSVCALAQVSVSVDASGQYSIRTTAPAWSFNGTTGQPLMNLQQASGQDPVGPYDEVTFDYDDQGSRHASIRSYRANQIVIFTLTYLEAASNRALFPSFVSYPAGLAHLTFSGPFAAPTFTKMSSDGPWLFFDSTGNSFILSPASNFMVSGIQQDSKGVMSAGVSHRISQLPAGFVEATILAAGPGINATYRAWGNALQQQYGKLQSAANSDITLRSVGYWTDSGSSYYYQSPVPIEETLIGVSNEFRSMGIPLGYLQLDSWFYPKGPSSDWTDRGGGIEEYVAAPALFPDGLQSFQSRLGLPLVTHARWIDASSPYRRQFGNSGNVVLDPKYWTNVAVYLRNAGAAVYEQDWLAANAQPDFNLTAPGEFLDNMADAMAGQGITIQYCMPGPRHVLQSVKYSNVTTIRASLDRFGPDRWTNFL